MFDIFRDVLTVGGVSGIIALVITASICMRYVQRGSKKIPELLAAAPTTIIGFYFGTAVGTKQLPSSPASPPSVTMQK
jgi:hypothetical protein